MAAAEINVSQEFF